MLRATGCWQRLLVTIGLMLTTVCLAGPIFRWTDADGKVHFGDRPQGTDATRVQVSPSPLSAPAKADRTERTERLLQEFAGERSQREADREKARKLAEKRDSACREARKRALEIAEAGYLYDRKDDGSKRILTEAEHRSVRADAKRQVAEFCD